VFSTLCHNSDAVYQLQLHGFDSFASASFDGTATLWLPNDGDS